MYCGLSERNRVATRDIFTSGKAADRRIAKHRDMKRNKQSEKTKKKSAKRASKRKVPASDLEKEDGEQGSLRRSKRLQLGLQRVEEEAVFSCHINSFHVTCIRMDKECSE